MMTSVLPLAALLMSLPNAFAHDEDDDGPPEQVQLHSSTMFGGPTQDEALIYVRNVSNHAVRLGDRRIVGEDGGRLQIKRDTCGYLVPAQITCTIEAHIVPGRAFAASLTLKDAWPSDVRAQLELRDGSVGPLARDNLR